MGLIASNEPVDDSGFSWGKAENSVKDVILRFMQWEAFVTRVSGRGSGGEATPVKQKGHAFSSLEKDDIMHMADVMGVILREDPAALRI